MNRYSGIRNTRVKGKQKALDAKNVVELRLYVAGQTPKSLTAIANLKKICADGFE